MYELSLEGLQNALDTYEIKNEYKICKEYIDNIDIHHIVCKRCLRDNSCRRHTGYDRYLVTVEDSKIIGHSLVAPRFRCKYCNKTFGIFSEYTGRYTSYGNSFVLNVERDYVVHRFRNVVMLCEHYQISVSTLYEWLSRSSYLKSVSSY